MSLTIPIQQAARELEQLLSPLGRGDEIVLTLDNQPWRRSCRAAPMDGGSPGRCKGMRQQSGVNT